ncbi:LysR family transcriptional regulator, partial [Mesorhizobium sp. M00.F.Ca.ET.186.01.1.1]
MIINISDFYGWTGGVSMELVYLHTFREVARWGSFTRAAEE